MPRERFYKLPAETRATLLRLAMKQFAEHGFEGASLNEILAAAGLSKGSYYYYFEDKEDLFATVLGDTADRIFERLVMPDFTKVTRAKFWPTLETFLGRWVEATDTPLELLQIGLQMSDAQRRSPRLEIVFERVRAFYRRLIVEGQRLGCIRKDQPIEVLIELMEGADMVVDRILAMRGKRVTRADIQEHVRLSNDTFRRLLEVRAAHG